LEEKGAEDEYEDGEKEERDVLPRELLRHLYGRSFSRDNFSPMCKFR
jgi:hypothetical protein